MQITHVFKNKIFYITSLSVILASPLLHADPSASEAFVDEPQPTLLTQAEIQEGLTNMRNKMNARIDRWGSNLARSDFERKRGKLVLKASKQLEVCNIFQGVIDETYISAQNNLNRLTPADQKNVQNRAAFIQAIGIKNNIIPTKLGFDCRVK